MDDGGERDGCDEVCGWEDSGGVFIQARHKRSLDFEITGDVDGFGKIGDRLGKKDIVNHAHETVGCCWNMTREEIGEGKMVFSSCEVGGFGEEFPAEKFGGLGCAISTVMLDGVFCGHFGFKDHLQRLDADLWLVGCENQLTREEGACRLSWRTVKYYRRGLHVNLQRSSFYWSELLVVFGGLYPRWRR